MWNLNKCCKGLANKISFSYTIILMREHDFHMNLKDVSDNSLHLGIGGWGWVGGGTDKRVTLFTFCVCLVILYL